MHTPGPWYLGGYCVMVATPERVELLGEEAAPETVCEMVSSLSPGATQANARLIAAAPELLAALKAAVERMEAVAEGIPVHNRHKGVSQAIHVAHMAGHLAQHAKIARAAIQKAEATQ